MRFLLCLMLLLASVTSTFGQELIDGTVVVWENGNYLAVIRRQTNSSLTHAGIVLYEGKQAWVYEASQPDVHRYTWEQYQQRIVAEKKRFPSLVVHYLAPSKPYTDKQLAAMKSYANRCLGVKFGVKSYLSGKPTNTLHCCEYVGNILYCSGRYKTLGPKENPKTIYDKASKL